MKQNRNFHNIPTCDPKYWLASLSQIPDNPIKTLLEGGNILLIKKEGKNFYLSHNLKWGLFPGAVDLLREVKEKRLLSEEEITELSMGIFELR